MLKPVESKSVVVPAVVALNYSKPALQEVVDDKLSMDIDDILADNNDDFFIRPFSDIADATTTAKTLSTSLQQPPKILREFTDLAAAPIFSGDNKPSLFGTLSMLGKPSKLPPLVGLPPLKSFKAEEKAHTVVAAVLRVESNDEIEEIFEEEIVGSIDDDDIDAGVLKDEAIAKIIVGDSSAPIAMKTPQSEKKEDPQYSDDFGAGDTDGEEDDLEEDIVFSDDGLDFDNDGDEKF